MSLSASHVIQQALENSGESPQIEKEAVEAGVRPGEIVRKEDRTFASPKRIRTAARRSSATEMAIAREVQRSLFPQRMPHLKTLDYAGICVEARDIGGDYYDFLDLSKGKVGFALADVSGKGVYAALLMANLQASLRSQISNTHGDLAGTFRSLNRLFCDSVASGFFATMFYAEYNDATRTLRYISCGHHPAFIVRISGHIEQLDSTATVLGVFEEWDCTIQENRMSPGDIFLIYSDGITEACNPAGEFFGEERLLCAVRSLASLPAADITQSVAQTAYNFGRNAHRDDLTLIVARAR